MDRPEPTPDPGPGVIIDKGAGLLEKAVLIGMLIYVILFGIVGLGCIIYVSIF